MLQLTNNTPFAANMVLLPDQAGSDTLYILVKATFRIGKQWTLGEVQTPLQEEDVYWSEPGQSSLKHVSDFHIGKPASDIIVLGHACTLNQQPVKTLDVSVTVGKVQKSIRVFGDRQWQGDRISTPKPFVTMPMVYEKAFGGLHTEGDKVICAEERNPVGCGYLGGQLPNLEDPNELIQRQTDQPEPACFAFKAPNWRPRISYAGTYDEVWQHERAPFLPVDFDKRFFNAAHKELIYPVFLQGGEPVQITNMHPKGNINFTLPRVHLISRVQIENNVEKPKFNMETLILEPNKLRLAMVWKAALTCDKKALKISRVTIGLTR